MLPRPQASLLQGATPRCDLDPPSSTCCAFFLLTHSHWQSCCCFASLHLVLSFGSRALDSSTTTFSPGYRATTTYSTSFSFLKDLLRYSQRFHTSICKAFHDLGRAPVIHPFSTFHPCYRSFHKSVPARPVVPTIHLPLDTTVTTNKTDVFE